MYKISELVDVFSLRYQFFKISIFHRISIEKHINLKKLISQREYIHQFWNFVHELIWVRSWFGQSIGSEFWNYDDIEKLGFIAEKFTKSSISRWKLYKRGNPLEVFMFRWSPTIGQNMGSEAFNQLRILSRHYILSTRNWLHFFLLKSIVVLNKSSL